MFDVASRPRVPRPALGLGPAQWGNLYRESSDEDPAATVDAAQVRADVARMAAEALRADLAGERVAA